MNTNENNKITVTALDPQFGAKLVELDAGATLADLSAALGKDNAGTLPAMDGNGQQMKPTDALENDMSVGYSFKVAGATEGAKITVTALDPQFGAKLVELDAGATLADLSAALGKDNAGTLPAMDGNGQQMKPTDLLENDMSVGYSFKVAGA